MFYFIPIIFLVFLSCNDDRQYISKMINETNKIAKKKYNLTPFGSGTDGPQKIKSYGFTFETKQIYTIDQARILLINLVEEVISTANKNEQVVSDLVEPPFSELHCKITIGFIDNKGDFRSNFSGIEIRKGIVYFLVYDSQLGFTNLFSESYAEAYFKVKGTYPPQR